MTSSHDAAFGSQLKGVAITVGEVFFLYTYTQ